jgi:uncharacterized protein (TIGR00251 family)
VTRDRFGPEDAALSDGSRAPKGALIRVHVTPNARHPSVERVEEGVFEVRVDARAEDGRANRRLVELLSENMHIPKSRFVFVSGRRSREKLLLVLSG